MVGQGYDGAGNMSGKRRGVQARIQQQIPNAVYTHCRAHCLNLAIVHACSETFVKNMIGTVQTVAFAFNYSSKRLLKYQDTLETDPQSTEAMGNRSKLANLCDTRWTARAKALDTFLCSYSTVVNALEFLADDMDAKAAAYRLSVSTFEFVITLVTTEHCIKSLVQLSENLQEKTCDLLKAAQEAKTQRVMLQNERNDITVWEELYYKAVNIARTVGVEPSMPRNNGRQRNRPNVPANTPSEFWRLNMYLPFIDHLITDLSDRLLQANERYLAQKLIPSQVIELH